MLHYPTVSSAPGFSLQSPLIDMIQYTHNWVPHLTYGATQTFSSYLRACKCKMIIVCKLQTLLLAPLFIRNDIVGPAGIPF